MPPEPIRPDEDRDTDRADMSRQLKALQDKYAKTRVGAEPRSFLSRARE